MTDLYLGQVCPAGKGAEFDLFGSREIEGINVTALPSGSVLSGAIEPETLEGLTGQEGVGTVDSGPMEGPFHQALLNPVRQEIPKSFYVDILLLGEHNSTVATAPDFLLPAVEPADLAGDLRVGKTHDLGEL